MIKGSPLIAIEIDFFVFLFSFLYIQVNNLDLNMGMIENYINTLVKEEVKKAIDEMKQSQIIKSDNAKPVYTTKEMLELLDVDHKTLKKYIDNGLLSSTHPFDKRFYTYQDLMAFLMNKNIREEAFNIK